jgi:hypothetical protein
VRAAIPGGPPAFTTTTRRLDSAASVVGVAPAGPTVDDVTGDKVDVVELADVGLVVLEVRATGVVVDAGSGAEISEETTSSGTSSGMPVTAMPARSEINATTTKSSFDLTAATG